MANRTLEFVDVSCLHGTDSEKVFADLFSLSGPGKVLIGWRIGRQVQEWCDFLPEVSLERLARTGMVRRQGFKGNYCIRYIPKRLFDVCGIRDLCGSRNSVQGKRAKVHDLSHWFDCSLGDACRRWNCSDLVSLASLLRDSVRRLLGVSPAAWYGPGPVAGQLMRMRKVAEHNVPPRDNAEGFDHLFRSAYYGGRIQALQIGGCGPSIRYDLRSAYAAAMARLPSLDGAWMPQEHLGVIRHNGLYRVSWSTPNHVDLTPFPWRGDDGHISYPREGRGWYWGSLLQAAQKGPWTITVEEGWCILPDDHKAKPFAYLERIHRDRVLFGDAPEADILKGVLVSSYGKLVQHGSHYTNKLASMAWAGMVTAQVQAWLLDAALQAPGRVASFLTDCLMLTGQEPLDLPIGPDLGQWAESRIDGLWVFQPAFYVTAKETTTQVSPGHQHGEIHYALHAAGAPDDQMLARRAVGQWIAQRLSGKVRFIQPVYCGMAMANLRGWEHWRTMMHLEQELQLRPSMGFPFLEDDMGLYRWEAWIPGRDYMVCSKPYRAHGEGLVDDRWFELEAIRAAEEC